MTEISPLLIYFIGQLSTIIDGCRFAFALGISLFLIAYVIQMVAFPEYRDRRELEAYKQIKDGCASFRKMLAPFIILSFLGVTFIPDRSTVAAMIVVPAISNNESIQNISKGALQWAEQFIQEQLNPKKEK